MTLSQWVLADRLVKWADGMVGAPCRGFVQYVNFRVQAEPQLAKHLPGAPKRRDPSTVVAYTAHGTIGE